MAMKRMMLALLLVLTIAGSCRAQKSVIDAADIIDLFRFRPSIAVGDNEESEAQELVDHAAKSFIARGFTQGLTGDGYGGPCVIIDGFYKGGTVNEQIYAFEPGNDLDQACVVEMSACNDGDASDYQLYMTVELFSSRAAGMFLHQFSQLGFTITEMPADDEHCTLSNGTIFVDYALEKGYANECHYFIIQTAERHVAIEPPCDEDEKDYQEN